MCAAYEIDPPVQSPNPYSSLFVESAYPDMGDLPLLNRKIFRGYRVSIREHPYVISIRRNYVHYVTATILTKNVAVSVAHPLYRVPINELSGVACENYSDRGTMVLTLVLLVINKNFDPYTLRGDIALLRFYEDLVTRSCSKPVALAAPTADVIGRRAFVTGWGRCDFTGKELCLPRSTIHSPDETSDPMLRTISFVVTHTNEHCDVYNKHYNFLLAGVICAGEARAVNVLAPCLAVPGAPMVASGKLVGILSWGLGCGYINDLPLIYTDTQHYFLWICKHLAIMNNITQEDFKDLFAATKSHRWSSWLLKTRVNKPLVHAALHQEMQPLNIDKDLSAIDAKLYDIRDFLYDGTFRLKKKILYKALREEQNSSLKLKVNFSVIPSYGPMKPFISNKFLKLTEKPEKEDDADSEKNYLL